MEIMEMLGGRRDRAGVMLGSVIVGIRFGRAGGRRGLVPRRCPASVFPAPLGPLLSVPSPEPLLGGGGGGRGTKHHVIALALL